MTNKLKLESTTGILFLTAILRDKGPQSFMGAFRLTRNHFTGVELKLIDLIQNYVDLYKSVPDRNFVEIEIGAALPDPPTSGTVSFWADEVRKRYAVENSYTMCRDILAKITEGDIDSAADAASRMTRILIEGQTKTRVYSLEDAYDTLLEAHNQTRLNSSTFGIPFGINFLDHSSGGAQGGDLITIAGRPGSSKTFLLLHMALSAYETGKNVMLIPTEMSEIQYHRRLAALRNTLSVNKIKFGELSSVIGIPLLKYDKELLEKNEHKFYMTDASMSLGMLDVKSSAYVYKPDAIYIDGAYLLRPETYAKSRYEMVSSVAESLKMLAKELNIPIIATYQINKKTDDIYQSDVVRQLSSIVIELADKTEDEGETWVPGIKPKVMNITKGRDGEEGSTLLLLDTNHTRVVERDPDSEEEDEGDRRSSTFEIDGV
jgi:replicative DNA helicase